MKFDKNEYSKNKQKKQAQVQNKCTSLGSTDTAEIL